MPLPNYAALALNGEYRLTGYVETHLQRAVAASIEAAAHAGQDIHQTCAAIRELAYRDAKRSPAQDFEFPGPAAISPPCLTEHWFCSAEPTRDQLISLIDR